MTAISILKRCYKCKQEQPLSAFAKKAKNPDGLQRICRSCQKIERKIYYDSHKEIEFDNHRKYEITHRNEINAQRSRRRSSDPDFYRRAHEADMRRAMRDLDYLVARRSRYRISRALFVQNAKPSHLILELLGCSIVEYRAFLESTFAEGMTWEAYRRGEMQIDHRIPCACFDLRKANHQLACFHFSNTRMLWAWDNAGRTKNEMLSPEGIQAYVAGFGR